MVTIDSAPDHLTFRHPPFTTASRVLVVLGFVAVVAVMAGLGATVFTGGPRSYRCDHAAGTCVEQPSGRVLANIANITRVSLGAPDYKADVWMNSGVVIHENIARQRTVCASGGDGGFASRVQVQRALQDFLDDPRSPPLQFTCMEGRASPVGTLLLLATTFLPLLVALWLGAFQRTLRDITLDRTTGLVRFRYGARLPLLRDTHRDFAFGAVKQVDLARLPPRGRSRHKRLQLALFFTDGTPGLAIDRAPETPELLKTLQRGLTEARTLLGHPHDAAH